MSTWTQSYSGRVIEIRNPAPSAFTLRDVAHALALKNRFSGMTPVPLSVAEHCVRGSRLLPDMFKLPFLLHELGEVALPDIVSPLKPWVKVNVAPEGSRPKWVKWSRFEEVHEHAILTALDLVELTPLIHAPEVREMDLQMLAWEARELMPNPPKSWNLPYPPPAGAGKLVPWSWRKAEREWLKTYARLTGDL